MDTYLSRHLPIITNRIEFFPQNLCSPPAITPRINFAEQLATEDSISTDASDCNDPNCNDDGSAMDISAPIVISTTPPSDAGFESSDSGTEETADSLDKKIPKPRGQPGHPGSGGYSLDFVLRNWGSTLIAEVNVRH
jgi:hypothetical protein